MRATLAILTLALSGGCARARVTRTDFVNQAITVCGNRSAEMTDLNAEAQRACVGPRALACGESVTGAVAQQVGRIGIAKPTYGLCCDYKCDRL